MYQPVLPQPLYPRYSNGLFRMALTGEPARLTQAFAALRRALGPAATEAPSYGARLPTGDGNDTWDMISLNDDIYVVMADCRYEHPRSELVLSESFVEFHYTLTGSAVASWSRAPAAPSGDLDLVVCHLGAKAQYQITCTPGRRRSVALYVRPEVFDTYLDDATPAARQVRRTLAGVGPDDLHFSRIPLHPAQAATVNQLLCNPYHDSRRLRYVQAKVQELLCASVDLWGDRSSQRGPALTLSSRDMRQLHEARRLLLQDLAAAPTIPQLAAAAGINTAKLKAGFRLLFGCTVYDCLWHARMTHAMTLLEGGASVSDTALAAGYRHASSFSAAFVRHYGYSPRAARQGTNGHAQTSAAVMVT